VFICTCQQTLLQLINTDVLAEQQQTALIKQLKRSAIVITDIQKEHAIVFGIHYLQPYLEFFYTCLINMPSTEQMNSTTNDTGISAFYIHSMKFLSAVVNCNSYRFDTLETAVAKGTITCSSSSSGDVPVTDEIATKVRSCIYTLYSTASFRLTQCNIERTHILFTSRADVTQCASCHYHSTLACWYVAVKLT
jgi:hypothetical protein